MKKLLGFMAVCLLSMAIFGVGSSFAEGEKPAEAEKTQEVKLTDAQKAELGKLHKSILEQKKQLVQKYVEYGVIPKETGDKMIQRFDEHYRLLEGNGFLLKGPQGGQGRGPHDHHKSEE